MGQSWRRRNSGRNNNSKPHIPEGVKYFSKHTFAKHKKEWDDDEYVSKKIIRRDYFDSLIRELPEVIVWLLKNQHKQDEAVKRTVNGCYAQFVNDKTGSKFVEYLTDLVKEYGVDDIPDIKYLPIILGGIIGRIVEANAQSDAPEEQLKNPDEFIKLSSTILKKRMKKAARKGIPEEIIFHILSIIPTKDAIKFGEHIRVRQLFDLLYVEAESLMIPFPLIMSTFVDSEYYEFIIGHALQERKDKYRSFNESQKKLFNDITTWVCNELETYPSPDIRRILQRYISIRKRDAANGKDSNRRYYISSLPKADYPYIAEVVEELISKNEENKKYL